MKIKFPAVAPGLFLMAIIIFLCASDSSAMSKRAVRLDDATRECMACHNMDAGKHFGPSHTAHIVGIDYVSKARRNPSLVPAASLDPRLKLVKDRISCITCHTDYTQDSHKVSDQDRDSAGAIRYPLLRVDNSGSALCLKCHRK